MLTYLDTLSEKVKRNVAVVTPETLGINYFLHISSNTNIKEFIPQIGTKQAPSEDRTVARVTVAPSILGCLIGHACSDYEFLELKSNGVADPKKDIRTPYKGGYKIYSLPFKVALKPTKNLVYDSKVSDEHWLIAYNKESANIIPESAGKMFYRSIRYVGTSNNTPRADVTIYVEVTKEGGIAFSKKHYLTKGYWVIEGPIFQQVEKWTDDSSFTSKEITASEYKAIKEESAALLSVDDKLPAFMCW